MGKSQPEAFVWTHAKVGLSMTLCRTEDLMSLNPKQRRLICKGIFRKGYTLQFIGGGETRESSKLDFPSQPTTHK